MNSSRPIFAPGAFASTGLLLLLISWGERYQQSAPSRQAVRTVVTYAVILALVGMLGGSWMIGNSRPRSSEAPIVGKPTPVPVPRQPSAAPPKVTASGEEPVDTDPQPTIGPNEAACLMTGIIMKKSEMIPVQHHGATYYLSSPELLTKFQANPHKYVHHPAPPRRQ